MTRKGPIKDIRVHPLLFTIILSNSVKKPTGSSLHSRYKNRSNACSPPWLGKYSPNDNEFCGTKFFGRLDGFSRIGYSGGVMPFIKFDKARIFLFHCLKSCKPGVWYETASLIQYLKKTHPFFLIPGKPAFRHQWEKEQGRYCNFFEYEIASNQSIKISEKDPYSF